LNKSKASSGWTGLCYYKYYFHKIVFQILYAEFLHGKMIEN